MTTQTVQFRVYRYNPDKDAKPYMQDISVEIDATDRKLLDALVKLKIKDDSMSFRRSCREGVCGSDAMNINGKNGLACLTDINSLAQPIVLRPLPGLPVMFAGMLLAAWTDDFQRIGGVTLVVLGVLVVLSRGEWRQLLGLRLVAGDLLMMLATIAWSLYSWLLTLPGEMGDRFQAIALTRGLDIPLRGFAFRDERGRL